jgi:HEAT repeat protein
LSKCENSGENEGKPVIYGQLRSPFILLLAAAAILGSAHCGQDTKARIAAIYEAKADPTDENLLMIREMLEDPDHDVRATALNALVGLGVADSAELALDGLRDEHFFVRSIAAKLLADLGDPAHVEVLLERLERDADPLVRQRSAEALERLGGEAAIRGLVLGLGDPMQQVRLAAARGIRALDPTAATTELARLALEDPIWEIRVQAVSALGATGDPSIRPVLEKCLEDPHESVRGAAANSLRIHEAVAEKGRSGGK